MDDETTLGERIAGGLSSAAKGAWLTAEATAIIASSPAAVVQDAGVMLPDPLAQSGLVALGDNHEALSSAIEARTAAEETAESTSVSNEPTDSLIVDAPSWLAEPTDIERSINEDLGFFTGDENDLGTDASSAHGDLGGGIR